MAKTTKKSIKKLKGLEIIKDMDKRGKADICIQSNGVLTVFTVILIAFDEDNACVSITKIRKYKEET